MTLAKNGDFSLQFTGSVPEPNSGGRSTTGMENYVLTGQDYNHKLRHSTLSGGTIQTTYEGNHSGKLDDGSPLISPRLIATASGQTITYTFIPEPGFALDKLYVNSGTNCTNWPKAADPVTGVIDYSKIHEEYGDCVVSEGDGSNGTFKAWDDDGDGQIDRYTYTFTGINSDNAIHVTWQKTRLTISKRTTGNDMVDDTFKFRIKAWKTDPETGDKTYVDFAAADSDFTPQSDNYYTFTLKGMETKNVEERVVAVFPADSTLLVIGISACLAGAVCGDHISPISDTTIMASAGANVDHIQHVNTQIPYALTVAGVSFVCFLVAGFVQNWVICLALGLALTVAVAFVLSRTVGQKVAA